MTRIGLIGAGGIARRHVEELSALHDVTVSAVVDLNPESARWVVDRTGASFFSDVQSALPQIDAAYVLTPPRARVEAIRLLAAAGIPIFCEKPLAVVSRRSSRRRVCLS